MPQIQPSSVLRVESAIPQVYTHRKSKAVEFMIVDALVEADKVMRFSDKVHSAAEFVTLDDGLLRNIEDYHLLTG